MSFFLKICTIISEENNCFLENNCKVQQNAKEVYLFARFTCLNEPYFCHNPNNNTAQPVTQPQHCSWVGHENDCAQHPTTPTPTTPPPTTTETLCQPLGTLDEHLLTTT